MIALRDTGSQSIKNFLLSKSMLTKVDLNAIKQTIQDVAVTKNDAKNFATKDNLKNLASKSDLKSFASKKDLVGLARGTEIDDLKTTFVNNLTKWKSEIFTKIDNLVTSLKPISEEQAIISGKLSDHSDTLDDHETRIGKLEKVLKPQN